MTPRTRAQAVAAAEAVGGLSQEAFELIAGLSQRIGEMEARHAEALAAKDRMINYWRRMCRRAEKLADELGGKKRRKR